MKPITWRAETRAIADLAAYDRNPRQFTKKGMADLTKSIERFGLAEPIVINTDGTVIGGHARLEVLRARGDVEVAVYVPDRKLTAKQLEELCVRLNANTAGAWDFEMLANEYDVGALSEWGLDIPDVDARAAERAVAPDDDEEVTCPHCGEPIALKDLK